MASFIKWVVSNYQMWKYKRERRKILKEIHKRDPFVY